MQKNHLKQFLLSIYNGFLETDCSQRAAGLAFTSLLTIVPLMAAGFAVFTYFPAYHHFAERLQVLIFQHLIADSARVAQTYLLGFINHAAQLSWVELISLWTSSVLMLFSIERTLNAIWGVAGHRHRISTFLIYWFTLLILPVIGVVGLVMNTAIMSSTLFSVSSKYHDFIHLYAHLLPHLLGVLTLSFLYSAMPNCRVSYSAALGGAYISALLFPVVGQIFSIYFSLAPSYQLLYGALSIIPIFLLWIYLCWAIILFGAVISKALNSNSVERT